VQQLDELYPHLREKKPVPGPTSTIGASVQHLDLATVIKVLQKVSGEIVLEKLIDTKIPPNALAIPHPYLSKRHRWLDHPIEEHSHEAFRNSESGDCYGVLPVSCHSLLETQ
jgi:hypothetical protein